MSSRAVFQCLQNYKTDCSIFDIWMRNQWVARNVNWGLVSLSLLFPFPFYRSSFSFPSFFTYFLPILPLPFSSFFPSLKSTTS